MKRDSCPVLKLIEIQGDSAQQSSMDLFAGKRPERGEAGPCWGAPQPTGRLIYLERLYISWDKPTQFFANQKACRASLYAAVKIRIMNALQHRQVAHDFHHLQTNGYHVQEQVEDVPCLPCAPPRRCDSHGLVHPDMAAFHPGMCSRHLQRYRWARLASCRICP